MLAFLAIFSRAEIETPVRATLSDGQVLMGEVKTRTLRLQTGVGELLVPIEDIGEVVPTSAQGLGVSEGEVDVWLRNGSELRGRWADPKLAMEIAVGGDDVGIDLPMNELSRFQLQGNSAWPSHPVFRMRTSFGDDFLVDPARTRLVVQNQLGTFSPVLEECLSAAPVGDPAGDWRIVLRTGTTLIGKLQDAAVTVALPMGPEAVTVPLEHFVSLRLEHWAPVAAPTPVMPYQAPQVREYRVDEAYGSVSEDVVEQSKRAPAAQGAAAGAPAPAPGGWFDRSALDAAKDAQVAPN